MDYLGWLFLALIAAAGVLVAAAVVSNDRENSGRGLSGFVADLSAGMSALLGRTGSDPDATAPHRSDQDELTSDSEPAAVVDMGDFFAGQERSGEGYVQAAEITATLEKARVVIRTHLPAGRPRNTAGPTRQSVNPARHASSVSGHVPAGSSSARLAQSQHTLKN